MSSSRALLILALPLSGCTTINNYYLSDTGDCCCPDEDTATEPAECPAEPLSALPTLTPQSCPTEPVMDPLVEWRWPEDDFQGDYTEVLVAPMIGDVSGDGVPDVVFTAFDSYEWEPGALVVLSGDDGSLLLYEDTFIDGGLTYQPPGLAGVALGDIDGDLVPEVCLSGMAVSVFCVQIDGSVVMAAGSTPEWDPLTTASYPMIAQLDGVGGAEVIIGHEIFDGSGGTLGYTTSDGGVPNGQSGAGIAVVSDLFGDGTRDAIFGNIATDASGTTTWSSPNADGLTAVSDLDGDGVSEIILATWGWLDITDSAGNQIVDLPLAGEISGGYGGPPLVADLDGDATLDVVVAGVDTLTAYSGALLMAGPSDLSAAVLWSIAPTEQVNGLLGASGFDIDNDGDDDVIFADEEELFILDGPTGSNLLDDTVTDFDPGLPSSESLFEYPTIADLDDDGSAEIVLASSQHTDNYDAGQWSGVRAIGSASSSWPDAPAAWPMHGYTPSLTDEGLSSTDPGTTDPEWMGSRTFRTQPGSWAGEDFPDLVVLDPELCVEECPDAVYVWVPVGNAGGADSPQTTITVAAVDASWSVSEQVPSLAPGEVVWTGPFLISDSTLWATGLVAAIDGDDLIEECDEGNNTLSLGDDPCEG